MSNNVSIRWDWLKAMYIYTLIGGGGTGLGMIFFPKVIQSLFKYPGQDPVVFGVFGSFLLGSGLLAILGIRSPLKFIPLLALQICYKSIWILGVLLPQLLAGHVPTHAVMLFVIFATYIVGDLIAIPFPVLFSKQAKT
jgi:hypothetical protein